MGKFINGNATKTSISEMLNTAAKSKLNNAYYLFTDKDATIVTYYNLNTTMTTLDESVRSNYGEVNANSPLRFNKVKEFYLYGLPQLLPSLNVGDYGLEGDDVTGEGIILPYTVVPYPGDFFKIDTLNTTNDYLFKVTSVNPNRLDTGATMYKITFTLSYTDGLVGDIEDQVVKTFNFIVDNVGTNYNCLVEEETYDAATGLEEYTTMLKNYYVGLFYDCKIQSFAYLRDGVFHVYDPYLIEFIIRNDILNGADEYLYVDQQMYLPSTFQIQYDRTFFYSLENCDMSTHTGTFVGQLWYVDQKLSLLYAYPIDYYYMEYDRPSPKRLTVNIFGDPAFNKKVANNDQTGDNVLHNIIIGYFNGETVTDDQLTALKHIDYMNNPDLFYCIPMVIFIFEQTLASLLTSDTSEDEDSETES